MQEALSLRAPPQLEMAPNRRFLDNVGKAPATCWVIIVARPSSPVSFGALDSAVIKALSSSNWSVSVQGKGFPEVASPSSALAP